MTFVSVVARADFISVMADGRIRWNREAIIDENYSKIRNYDNRAFISFSGVLGNINDVLDEFEKVNTNYNFSEWVKIIQNLYASKTRFDARFPSTFALGGLNDDNEIQYLHFTCGAEKDEEPIMRKPPEENGKWFISLLQSETASQKEVNSMFEKYLSETPEQTISNFVAAQKLLNNYVASFDLSVNTNTNRLLIKKPKQ